MKIVVCDDHSIFRAGLVAVLEDLPDDVELVESDSAAAALEAVESGGVSLVLLDLHMPGMDGWGALRALRSSHPSVAVVIVSASEDAVDIRAALEAGASGFIPKSSTGPLLRAALEVVFSGGVYVPQQLLEVDENAATPSDAHRELRRTRATQLTPRQREVLILMSRGLSNREIAEILEIAAGTVKTHVAALFEILDVSNRTEATLVLGELDLE